MQTTDDYVFQLDAPLEQPTSNRARLFGWIVAHKPISDVQLLGGSASQILSLEERADIALIFPGHAYVKGFEGHVGPQDLSEGGLTFRFALGGVSYTVREFVAPPPTPPPWQERIAARVKSAYAATCLLLSRTREGRWNNALSVLLTDIRRSRGASFRRTEGDRLLALFAEHFPDAVVVQIGANDGDSADPLASHFTSTHWTGVLVEPIPDICLVLSEKYRERTSVSIEQSAISDRDGGEVTLFRLADEPGKTPRWFQHLATLDRTVLLKSRSTIPDIEKRIVEERVPVMSLNRLAQKYSLSRIDLLVIDTEGHDYTILRQVEFSRFHPILIMFEHQHLPSEEKAEAYTLLQRHGYRWAETPEGDTFAWRRL